MTLGNKLAALRKSHNLTQEQLAETLNVSRQAVSKWESGAAIPETEKLIRLSEMYGCTLDYLIKDETAPQPVKEQPASFFSRPFRDRKSKTTIRGVPLWHFGKHARGVIAIGLEARGILALGFLARGVFSVGLLSVGLFAFGSFAVGLLAFGAFSLGMIALGAVCAGIIATGALSLGVLSFGAVSVGSFSAGALAIAKYAAIGDHARAMVAVGVSEAHGILWQKVGTLTPQDSAEISYLLDSKVPFLLSWAKGLFKLFL